AAALAGDDDPAPDHRVLAEFRHRGLPTGTGTDRQRPSRVLPCRGPPEEAGQRLRGRLRLEEDRAHLGTDRHADVVTPRQSERGRDRPYTFGDHAARPLDLRHGLALREGDAERAITREAAHAREDEGPHAGAAGARGGAAPAS